VTIKMAVSAGVLSVSLTGCGTAATVLQDEAEAAQGLRRQKTYCQSIPRVYSGLAYDFCVLNAPRGPGRSCMPLAARGLPPLLRYNPAL